MIRPKGYPVDLLYQCLQFSAQVDVNTSSSCIPNPFNSSHSEQFLGVLDLKKLFRERGLYFSKCDPIVVCLQIEVPFLFEC